VYSTAKAGLEHFTRVLNADLAGTGVSASCLTLGAIPDVGLTVELAARSGAELPAVIRRTSPTADKVARMVLRVIRTRREAQFAVPGARVMIRHPKLAARLMRLNGMAGFLEQAAAGSREPAHGPRPTNEVTHHLG
jgi:short-subunit dehydrogenase